MIPECPGIVALDPVVALDYAQVAPLLSDAQRYILKQPHAKINVPAMITLDNHYQVVGYSLPYQHLPHPKTGTLLQQLPNGHMVIAGRLGVIVHTDFRAAHTAHLQLFDTIFECPTQDYSGTLAQTFLLNRLDYEMPCAMMQHLASQLDEAQALAFRLGQCRLYGTLALQRDNHRVLDFIPTTEPVHAARHLQTRLHALTHQLIQVDASTNGTQIQVAQMLAKPAQLPLFS